MIEIITNSYTVKYLKLFFYKQYLLIFIIFLFSVPYNLIAQSNYFGNYIISDNSGNTYAAGNFRNKDLKFGNSSISNYGESDIYLAKYDNHGKIIWAKNIGGTGDDKILKFSVDGGGNITLSGNSNSNEINISSTKIINDVKSLFTLQLSSEGDLVSSSFLKISGKDKISSKYRNLNKTSDNDTTIVLVSPKGGDNWKVGAKGVVEWESQNVSRVLIELSVNNGQTWQKLFTSVLFDFNNQYALIVPNTPSDSCLVRVSDYYNTSIADTSGLFSISGFLYWQIRDSGYNSVLRNVFFITPSTVWAAGFNGLIGTTDKGETWVSKLEGYGLLDLFFLNRQIGWTVGLSGTIFKTTDGGNNWTQLKNDSNFHFEKVFFADESNGFMIGKNYFLKTTDGGENWDTKEPTDHILQTMFFINKDTGWIAGNEGVILKTTDAGETWSYQQSNGTDFGTLTSLHFVNQNIGWASGSGLDIQGGVILNTTNGGDNWTLQHNGYNTFIFSVCFKDSASGWAAGDEGVMFNTTNGGKNWELQGSGTFANLYATNVKSFENGWTVGDDGTVLNYVKNPDSAVLPVELTSFKAESKGNTVELNWVTSTELNNKGFEIERKISDEWEPIAFITGKGTTTSVSRYSYTDNLRNTKLENVKYRLKQIDYDGTYKFSNEIAVSLNIAPVEYNLSQNYPNPFNPSTTINYSLKENVHVILKLYDVLGREVSTLVNEEKKAGSYSINFDAAARGLSSGMYIYLIKAGNFTQTRKMLLLK